ncbi:hypothetical protein [Burkholderia contaminans]|uniref:hypothetical protein n=1 Tax=Burkholderia contaminans TaxID=488447 RepID=UPI001583BB82|nr:hypothetical protein [Burkholderia contaminans]
MAASKVGRLTDYDTRILATLDTSKALTTGEVARAVAPVFGGNRRTHAGAIRSWLTALERQGFVKRLDATVPQRWLKINEG